MMLPLLLSLVVSVTDDPPVKVWLNHDNYFQRGDKARVNVRLADDGYLLVLRADAEGRVRVLFPLDPSNDNFTRGHETIRSEEHTSELQSPCNLVCRLLLEKKKKNDSQNVLSVTIV